MSALVLLAIFVVIVFAIYAGDRVYKVRAQARKRQKMHGRLAAVVVRAEKQHQKRRAAEHASAELTSVIPAIKPPPLSLPDMDASTPRRPTGGELPDHPEAGGTTADADRAGQAAGPRVSRRSPDTPAS